MKDTARNEIREVVSDVFGVPLDEVSETSSPQTIEQWDSLQQLNLVLALESRFGVTISPEEIERLTDVGAIVRLLEHKLNV